MSRHCRKSNINTATKNELEQIVPVELAADIVNKRKSRGRFKDMNEVHGLCRGDKKKYQKVLEQEFGTLLYINNATVEELSEVFSAQLAHDIVNQIEKKGKFKDMNQVYKLLKGDVEIWKEKLEQKYGSKLLINTATKNELSKVIPAKLADDIVTTREYKGQFMHMDELDDLYKDFIPIYKQLLEENYDAFLLINAATKSDFSSFGFSDSEALAWEQCIDDYGPLCQLDNPCYMYYGKMCSKIGNIDFERFVQILCEIKLNLNTATVQQLQYVGISMMLAIMIVDLRERKGFFILPSQLDGLKKINEDDKEMIWSKCEIGKFNLYDAKMGELELLGIEKKTLRMPIGSIRNILNHVCGEFVELRKHCFADPSEDEQLPSVHTLTRNQFQSVESQRADFVNSLNLFALNVNSLTGKMDELKELMSHCGESPDAVCLCETKLRYETRTHDITNFTFYFVPSQTNPSKSGGVGIYVESTQTNQHIRRKDLEIQIGNCENMWMEIEKLGRKIVVGTVYRPPGDDYIEFADSLADVINKVKQEGLYYVILGDININLFDAHKHRVYIKLLCHLGCRSIIKEVTRRASGTLIDHIYTNIPPGYIKAGIIETYISDHYTTCCFIDMAKLPQVPAIIDPCRQMENLSLWDMIGILHM